MRQPVPAAKFITDLGPRKEGAPASAAHPEPAALQALRLSMVRDSSTPEQRIARARAEGLEEGRAAARTEFEAKIEDQRAQYEKQLALERLTWAGREAEKLAEQLSKGLLDLENRIADTAAELLKPFLIAAAHRRAIDDLMDAIATVLTKDQGLALEIAGPEDLLQLLRERMSGKNIALLFTPNDSPEVSVRARQTVLETQLGAWVTKVEEALR